MWRVVLICSIVVISALGNCCFLNQSEDSTPLVHATNWTIDIDESVAADIYLLTNEERQKEGLSPLIIDLELERLAQEHAEYMWETGECTHYGFSLRAEQVFNMGYSNVSENVAYNERRVASSFIRAWMNSTGHRMNILDNGITHIGVGVCGDYAVQLFAGY
jgi:uncharacterized protein YkwD